ncbi:HEAT repeat domain-containing protein [Paenibacillus hamazuiensis]|uniref:HEAT repeat domain-containing protein n=1 Tax=Paenibacillus hamazuiensis TaxID=2936508 RepID=UPI00200C1DCA|nr:HEAT repeat domain-containing protein [Paenibacillus hamazuiensis]
MIFIELTPDQVKPFILHPEPAVSHAALEYFADSNLHLGDLSLMPLVLQRLQQVKKGEIFHLHEAYHFPQTEETVTELLKLLSSPDFDHNTQFHLTRILLHSDLSLLAPHLEVLRPHQEFMIRLQNRMDIAGMSNDELFEAFQLFLKGTRGKYYNEIDTFYGEELVGELARRRCLSDDRVLHTLDSDDPYDLGYDTIYYVQLAGEMQLEAAIPHLCRFLSSEDDILPAKAARALVRIGTESVIITLTEAYKTASEKFFRLFASDVFGKIKLPVSGRSTRSAAGVRRAAPADCQYTAII